MINQMFRRNNVSFSRVLRAAAGVRRLGALGEEAGLTNEIITIITIITIIMTITITITTITINNNIIITTTTIIYYYYEEVGLTNEIGTPDPNQSPRQPVWKNTLLTELYYKNASLPNVWGWGRGSLLHRRDLTILRSNNNNNNHN